MCPDTRYSGDEFLMFSRIASVTSQSVLMKWMPDLSASEPIEHLCFDSSKVSRNMFATVHDNIGKQEYVTAALLTAVVDKVKRECTGLTLFQNTQCVCFALVLYFMGVTTVGWQLRPVIRYRDD